jgi:hypothetical protein
MDQPTDLEAKADFAYLLSETVRAGGKVTDAHLKEICSAIEVEDTKTIVRCYRLPIDANGKVRFKPLAEFLRDRIIDYAIPRKRIDIAKNSFDETGSTALFSKLDREARALFTSLSKSGEGGELLVFAFAEAVFGLTQIICKMSLKTSPQMHYHGADGVYAKGNDDGGLNVYWGESKLYGDPTVATRDCLSSLAPFLVDPEGSDASRAQDVFLINEFAEFDDPNVTEGLKKFFDFDDEKSLALKHCGIALVGFNCSHYLEDGKNTDDALLESRIGELIPKWIKQIKKRLGKESIENHEIIFICVPMRAVEEFRSYFLSILEA